MKHTLLFFSFIFLLSVTLVKGQSFTYETTELNKAFVPDPNNPSHEVVSHGFVTNNDVFTTTFVWEKKEILLPDGWDIQICDKTACYFPTVFKKDMDLAASEQGILDVHTVTKGLPGDTAITELCVWVKNDSANTVQCSTYVVYADMGSSSSEVDDQDVKLRLTPNPTTNYFSVDTKQSIGQVEIFNIVGAKIKSFDSRDQEFFEVTDLSSGMYLVRIYNENNSDVLSTLRLNKR